MRTARPQPWCLQPVSKPVAATTRSVNAIEPLEERRLMSASMPGFAIPQDATDEGPGMPTDAVFAGGERGIGRTRRRELDRREFRNACRRRVLAICCRLGRIFLVRADWIAGRSDDASPVTTASTATTVTTTPIASSGVSAVGSSDASSSITSAASDRAVVNAGLTTPLTGPAAVFGHVDRDQQRPVHRNWVERLDGCRQFGRVSRGRRSRNGIAQLLGRQHLRARLYRVCLAVDCFADLVGYHARRRQRPERFSRDAFHCRFDNHFDARLTCRSRRRFRRLPRPGRSRTPPLWRSVGLPVPSRPSLPTPPFAPKPPAAGIFLATAAAIWWCSNRIVDDEPAQEIVTGKKHVGPAFAQ